MKQHLHHKLIKMAGEKLSTTNLTISEIASQLGFEHLQSLSKMKRRPACHRSNSAIRSTEG